MPDAVAVANSMLGKPYVWGGDCPDGVDCSGLVHQAYPNLPRVAHLQKQATTPITDASQTRAGDLVFLHRTQQHPQVPDDYASHVGILDGKGNVIHASSAHGKVISVPLSQFTNSPNFYGFGRVAGQPMASTLTRGKTTKAAPTTLVKPTTAPAVTAPNGTQPPATIADILRNAQPTAPAPTPPDLQGMQLQRQQFEQQAAQNPALNAYTNDAVKTQAAQAQLQAEQPLLPHPSLDDPRYNFTPYTPQALPVRQQDAIPDRPAPGNDLVSGILAGIGGAIDPIGAGQYAASPIEAALHVANQQYNDALTRHSLATQQADKAYNDALAAVQQANEAQLYNQKGTLQAATNYGNAQDAAATRDAQIAGQAAGNQSTLTALNGTPTQTAAPSTFTPSVLDVPGVGTALYGGVNSLAPQGAPAQPGLVQRSADAITAGVNAQGVTQQIQIAAQQYQEAVTAYHLANDPITKMNALIAANTAKEQLENIKQTGLNNRNTNSVQGRKDVATTNAGAKTGAAGINAGAKVKTAEINANTQKYKTDNKATGAGTKNVPYKPVDDAQKQLAQLTQVRERAQAAYTRALTNPLAADHLTAIKATLDRANTDVQTAQDAFNTEKTNAIKAGDRRYGGTPPPSPTTPGNNAATGRGTQQRPNTPAPARSRYNAPPPGTPVLGIR